ncbi:MAG: hypothetical protein WAW13_00355 [Minisyncoccia bacterium]
MFDGKAFGDEMAAMVRKYVDATVGPMAARIETLERELAAERSRDLLTVETVARQIGEAVSAIPQPEPVKIDTEALAKIAADAARSEIEQVVASLPAPKDGEPGKSVSIDDVRPLVADAVKEAVDALPAPKDGEPGKDYDPDELQQAVKTAVEALPRPQDGKSVAVEDVRPLIAELVSQAVSALPVAKDGVGAAGALIDRDGNLVLTLTDGTTRDLGRVVGKDGETPKDGERGPAGFALEDFDSEIKDGGRTLVLSFTAGEIKHTVEHQLDTLIYRGVFKDGDTYQPGDTVSFGGGLWHCNAETAGRPGEESQEWTLAVRRGRDGKSVSMDDVAAQLEKRMAEIEAVLAKRLDMAKARSAV